MRERERRERVRVSERESEREGEREERARVWGPSVIQSVTLLSATTDGEGRS